MNYGMVRRGGFAISALIILAVLILSAVLVGFIFMKATTQSEKQFKETQQELAKLYEKLKSSNIRVLVVHGSDIETDVINNLEVFFKKSSIEADFKTPSHMSSKDFYGYSAIVLLATNELLEDNLFIYDLVSKARLARLKIIVLDFAHKYEKSPLFSFRTFILTGGKTAITPEFKSLEEFKRLVATVWGSHRVLFTDGLVLVNIRTNSKKLQFDVSRAFRTSCPLYEFTVAENGQLVLYIYDQPNKALYKFGANGFEKVEEATVKIDATNRVITIETPTERKSDIPYVLLADICTTSSLLNAQSGVFKIPMVYIDGTYYVLNGGNDIKLTPGTSFDTNYFSLIMEEKIAPEGTLHLYLNKGTLPAVVISSLYNSKIAYLPGEPFTKSIYDNSAWYAILGGILLYLAS